MIGSNSGLGNLAAGCVQHVSGEEDIRVRILQYNDLV